MKQCYLDINADIINEVFQLKSENKIDEILQSIVNGNIGKEKKPIKKEKAASKKSKKKDSIRKISIRRIK